MTAVQEPLLVDRRSAARLLGVTESALKRWSQQGRGPRPVKLGRAVRYRLSDLQHVVERGGLDLG